jgi:hypothetical protein
MYVVYMGVLSAAYFAATLILDIILSNPSFRAKFVALMSAVTIRSASSTTSSNEAAVIEDEDPEDADVLAEKARVNSGDTSRMEMLELHVRNASTRWFVS